MLAASTLLVIRDYLKNSALAELVPPNQIQVTPNEQPWPSAGQLFVGVHATNYSNTSSPKEQVKKRRLDFTVTIVKRTKEIPMDRLDESFYLSLQSSLGLITDVIIETIDTNVTIYNNIYNIYNINSNNVSSRISSLLSNYTIVNTFPRFLDCDIEPIPRFYEFFQVNINAINSPDRPVGHSISVRFLGPEIAKAIDC